MKDYIVNVSSIISLMFLTLLPMPALADQASKQPQAQQGQSQQEQAQGQLAPDLLIVEIVPEPGMGAAPPSGQPMTLTRGKLTGEVINIDKQAGSIDIKTEKGVVNSFNVEGKAKEQMESLKKGDKVNLVLTLRAVEITPEGQG